MATYYSSWTPADKGENRARLKIVTSYSQNTTGNYSTVTVKEYVEFSSKTQYTSWTSNHKLNHTGTTYTNSNTYSYGLDDTSSIILLKTATKRINHNASGGGSFYVSGSADWDGCVNGEFYYSGTLSISRKTISLPTINRVSSITSNASSTTKFGDTITFTISRHNSNFTHNITYSMYGASGTIATGVGTSESWTIPTELIESTPNNAKPTISITCTTYNGSTKIGSSSCSFACNVPETYVPNCSLALEDIGTIPAGWNIWVKGKSIVKGTITASGSGGSTIKSYLSRANDEIFTINPFITGLLKNNGERVATATVTDTRGRTATDTSTINVVDYIPPTIAMCKVERCNQDGTLNDEGTYGKCTIGYKISPINNGTTDLNTKTLKVNYGTVEKTITPSDYEGTHTFAELFYGLETNASYNFEFSLIDSFETIHQTFTLAPAFVTISKLAGGKGVTFGQVATEEGLISHMPTKMYKDNWAKNMSIDGLKTEKVQGGWICYADDET